MFIRIRAGRALRWIEVFLLGLSLGALAIWTASIVLPAALELWANRDFDRELRDPPQVRPPVGPTALATNTLVGRLYIPRLNLTAMVREGDQERTLSLALGHIPGTALPGQGGNVGVAGHRDAIFRGLRYVKKGDLIRIQTLDGNYSYQVEETEIVQPHEVSVLKASRHPQLTLVTCYPFYYVGSAPQRFIVKAREIGSSAASSAQTALRQGD